MKGTGGGTSSYYVCVPGLFFFSQQSHTMFSRRICEVTTVTINSRWQGKRSGKNPS